MHREPRGNGGRCFAFPAPASLRPGRAVTSGLREDSTDIYPCSPPIPRPWRGLAQMHRRRQTASGDRGSQRPRQQQGPVTLPGRSPAASLALVRGFVPAGTRARDPPPTQGLALPGMPCPATLPPSCHGPARPRCDRNLPGEEAEQRLCWGNVKQGKTGFTPLF